MQLTEVFVQFCPITRRPKYPRKADHRRRRRRRRRRHHHHHHLGGKSFIEHERLHNLTLSRMVLHMLPYWVESTTVKSKIKFVWVDLSGAVSLLEGGWWPPGEREWSHDGSARAMRPNTHSCLTVIREVRLTGRIRFFHYWLYTVYGEDALIEGIKTSTGGCSHTARISPGNKIWSMVQFYSVQCFCSSDGLVIINTVKLMTLDYERDNSRRNCESTRYFADFTITYPSRSRRRCYRAAVGSRRR